MSDNNILTSQKNHEKQNNDNQNASNEIIEDNPSENNEDLKEKKKITLNQFLQNNFMKKRINSPNIKNENNKNDFAQNQIKIQKNDLSESCKDENEICEKVNSETENNENKIVRNHNENNEISDTKTTFFKKVPDDKKENQNFIISYNQKIKVNSPKKGNIGKKKSKLKFILIIVSNIIIGIVIYFLLKKNNDGRCEGKCDEEKELKTGSGEIIIVKIDRKINQMWEYQGIEFTSTINVLEDSSSLRRNEQINKTTKINYLLNVYNNETLSDNSILFSGFAMILSKITLKNDEEIYEGGVNLLECDYTRKEKNLF